MQSFLAKLSDQNFLESPRFSRIPVGKTYDWNICIFMETVATNQDVLLFNPKNCGLLGGVFFGETKFALSNFLSNEDLSSSYESWDVQLTFDTLINIFRFKA